MGGGLAPVAILIALLSSAANATGERADSPRLRKADGVTARATTMEVVVARIGEDGKPALACVNGEETARLVLEKPIPTAEPKEQ